MQTRKIAVGLAVAALFAAACGGGGGGEPGDTVPPVLTGSPTDEGAWTSVSVLFSWDQVSATDDRSGVAGWRVQVATAPQDSAAIGVFDVGAAATSYVFDATSRTDGSVLYARVAALDGAGNASDWSPWTDGVTLDTTPPVLAGGVRDAGAWDDASVAFDWDAATDAGIGLAGYVLEIASLPTPGAVLATLTPAGTSTIFDASAYADGDAFYARIAAVDALGNQGAFSAFTDGVLLDAAPPDAPGTPGGPGAFALASPVRFQWTAATDAVSGVVDYRVRVATANDGTGLLLDTVTGGAPFLDFSSSDGQALYARVSAVDAAGFEGGSSAWSAPVVVDLLPPGAPGTPSDDGDFTRSPARFSWTPASDTASGIASYVLHVTDEGGADVFLGDVGGATSHDLPAADGARLFARVAAVDGAGRQGPFSGTSDGIRADTTGPTAPGQPTGPGPYGGATIDFAWTPSTDAWSGVASYLLEVSTAPDFSAVVYSTDTGPSTTLAYDASGRADGESVFARVRAVDVLGNVGPLSPPSSGVLVDRSPPSVPGTPADGGDSQFERTVHFSWAPSADAVSGLASYAIEIATSPGGTPIHTASTAVPSYDFAFAGALPATLHARVQALDAAGNASAFSADSDGITVRDDVPGVPGTPTADAGAFVAGDLVAFTWTAPAAGAPVSDYLVDVGTSAGASDVVLAAVVPAATLSFVLDASLRPNGETYYARVTARNPAGTGAASGSSAGVTRDVTAPSDPGAPVDHGDLDDRFVTFDWTEAPSADAESGIADYLVTIFADGAPVGTFTTSSETYTFDAGGRHGQTIQASVQARNGAGLTSADSALSDGVMVDEIPPTVFLSPGPGATGVGTNSDVVLQFSEPMDEGIVESAFSMAIAGASPRNGYVFLWNGDSSALTVVADTEDPFGPTNVDLFPQLAQIRVVLSALAADVAGNAVQNPLDATFTTADEAPPALASISVGGDVSPVAAAAVQGAFALALAFDEDMDPARGAVALRYGERRVEARFEGAGISGAVAAGGGSVTYTTIGCHDVRAGDRVTVRFVDPPSFDVENALVTAVSTAPTCTFTVANPTADVYQGGGMVFHPTGSGARPAWIGPRTLVVTLEQPFPLPAGGEADLEGWDLADVSGNWTNVRSGLQVEGDPATDAVPPALISSIPRDLASAVPGMRPVVLRFSEPLDRATLGGVTAVAGGDGDLYRVEYSSGDMGPVVVLAPRASPAPGTVVSIHVPATVRDLAGNPATPVDLTFTVGPSADVTGPVMVESLPPSTAPVGDTWAIEAAFGDPITGRLDALDARSVGPEDVLVLDDETGMPLRGWRVEVEPGSAVLTLQPPPRGPGLRSGPSGKTYTIMLGVPAFLGGTGFTDAHGNEATAAAVFAAISPTPNRAPTVDSLRSLRVGTSSSPAGRSLEVRFGIRDADGGVVNVSATALGGTLPLPALARALDLGTGSSAWYDYPAGDGGGPPVTDDPVELGLPAFAASGWYPFEITVDDGADATTYLRQAWLWSPADAPSPVGVLDGGVLRNADAQRPIVVELTDRPTLRWTGVDVANADFIAAYVASFAAAAGGGPSLVDVVPLPAEDVEVPLPTSLDVDAYLWTVAQAKFAPGSFDPVATSFGIDFTSPLASMMVHGPANRGLDGQTFGVARTVLEVDPSTRQLTRMWDATGWYDFELSAGGEAPVFVAYNLLDNSTQPVTSPPRAPEIFAAGTDASFMVTDTPAGAPLPLAAHGFLGRGGTFFAVAAESESFPSITAGSLRYSIGPFPADLPGPMVYVQAEAASTAPGILDFVTGSVGTAVHAGSGQLDVAGTSNDGSPFMTSAPYAISQEGLVEIDIGGPTPGSQFATGYLGGAPGAEIAVIASDSTPGRIFWLIMAREAAWAGTETAAALSGEYRFADFTIGRDPGTGGLARADGASGRAFFDGAGGFAYEVRASGGTMSGVGTYSVDPVAHRVALVAATPEGTNSLVLVVGPDFGTLLGLGTQDPEHAEVLVLSRAP